MGKNIIQQSLDEPYFSIFDCKICLSLPDKKDLPSDETMLGIPDLKVVHSYFGNPGRYCNTTDLILKCEKCGTYYHHYHSIDTEDAFVGGPSISQNLLRYNLLRLKKTYELIGNQLELNEIDNRYPAIIQAIKKNVIDLQKPVHQNIFHYTIENITDFYIMTNDWSSLRDKLFYHHNKEIGLQVAHDLIIMISETSWNGVYPFFTYYKSTTSEFQQIVKEFMTLNLKEFRRFLQKFDPGETSVVVTRYKSLINTAKYYKVL